VSLLLLGGLLPAGDAQAAKGVDGVVNLNTAGVEVLALLPGVGPAKAAAILAYRRRRPFRPVDELVRIKGIGRKMVRRLRPHLSIAGPTTAAVAPSQAPVAPPASPGPPPPARAIALHCPPPRPPLRPLRTSGRERAPPPRPFSAPCLGPR
jgi:competence protein ComEA